jgi:hypothetical protein
MKKFWFIAAVGMLLPLAALGKKESSTGDTKFIAYEGPQNWPTETSAQVVKDFAVPIYIGLPNKSYKVLGRVYEPRAEGVGVIGQAFEQGLGSENRRMRNVANQARTHGADAVVVSGNDRFMEAFKLTSKEISDTAPLYSHRDQVVVAVKFE